MTQWEKGDVKFSKKISIELFIIYFVAEKRLWKLLRENGVSIIRSLRINHRLCDLWLAILYAKVADVTLVGVLIVLMYDSIIPFLEKCISLFGGTNSLKVVVLLSSCSLRM